MNNNRINEEYRNKLLEFLEDELKAAIKYKQMCAYVDKLGENFGSYYMVYMYVRDICSIASDELKHFRMIYEILISTTRLNATVDFNYRLKVDRMSKTEIFENLIEMIKESIEEEINDYNEYVSFRRAFKDKLGKYSKYIEMIISDESRHKNILKASLRFME